MSTTDFSNTPIHERKEVLQDIIDLLIYDNKACKEIMEVAKKYPKPYSMEDQVVYDDIENKLIKTGRKVRTVKIAK